MKYLAETRTAERENENLNVKDLKYLDNQVKLRLNFPLNSELDVRCTWTEVENENSETEDLKYLDRQQEKERKREEHRRDRSQRGTRDIRRYSRGKVRTMHQSVGNCFTFYSFADHTGGSLVQRYDREHVITLRTRDKRYLSSNFLVLSTSACECANFFRQVSFPKPFVPLSSVKRYQIDRSIVQTYAKLHCLFALFTAAIQIRYGEKHKKRNKLSLVHFIANYPEKFLEIFLF